MPHHCMGSLDVKCYVIIKLSEGRSGFLDVYDGIVTQIFFSKEEAEQYGMQYHSVTLREYSGNGKKTVIKKFIVECIKLDI